MTDRTGDVARAEATPVSYFPSRAELRAHSKVQVKCRVRVRDRIRCRLRDMVRVTVRARVRSQEAAHTEPTAEQMSPRKAEWSTQGRVPIRSSLWVPRPDKCVGHPSGRPQVSSHVAAVALWK